MPGASIKAIGDPEFLLGTPGAKLSWGHTEDLG
jgi:hypothetical protein